MRVPLLDLRGQMAPLRDEILAEIADLYDSTGYILGPRVQRFEGEAARYCGAAHGIGVSSGTDALLAAMMALGVGEGDYVLTTPYTFIATLGCILRLGARPLFADIDPVSYNIDPERMEEVLRAPEYAGRVKAVLPVHLYGQCADMRRIGALAAEHGIPVVEDAAQAIGAMCPLEENGRRVWKRAGTMGDAGCFSFFPSKNLGAIGDGGLITVNDAALAEKIRIIRVHGGSPKYHHAVVGGNFRLDPIQAAALSVKLPHLPGWHRARRDNAERYRALFSGAGLVDSGVVRLPVAVYAGAAEKDGIDDYHIYNQFVIRVRDRDALKKHLDEHGIGSEIYYPIPMHKQGCVAHLGVGELSFPEAEKAALCTLALPIYPELTPDMQAYVVEKIAEFYQA